MPDKIGRKLPIHTRIKIAIASCLSLIITTACTLLRPRPTSEIMCYQVAPPPTDTPSTPIVMCYEIAVTLPSTPTIESPTPSPMCYTPTPSSTPTPSDSPLATSTLTPTIETPTLSPLCYTPLPSQTLTPPPQDALAPTSTLEARRLLREKLIVAGRFPDSVVQKIKD
jgi:hypothetical protein